MKNAIVYLSILVIVVDFLYCQPPDTVMIKKKIKFIAKSKVKLQDTKAVAYGVGSATKLAKGTVAGVVGNPLKIVGVILGPLGIPLKIVGGALQKIAVLEKTGAGVLAVKKRKVWFSI